MAQYTAIIDIDSLHSSIKSGWQMYLGVDSIYKSIEQLKNFLNQKQDMKIMSMIGAFDVGKTTITSWIAKEFSGKE